MRIKDWTWTGYFSSLIIISHHLRVLRCLGGSIAFSLVGFLGRLMSLKPLPLALCAPGEGMLDGGIGLRPQLEHLAASR